MKAGVFPLMLLLVSLALVSCGKKGELEPPDKRQEQASIF